MKQSAHIAERYLTTEPGTHVILSWITVITCVCSRVWGVHGCSSVGIPRSQKLSPRQKPVWWIRNPIFQPKHNGLNIPKWIPKWTQFFLEVGYSRHGIVHERNCLQCSLPAKRRRFMKIWYCSSGPVITSVFPGSLAIQKWWCCAVGLSACRSTMSPIVRRKVLPKQFSWELALWLMRKGTERFDD